MPYSVDRLQRHKLVYEKRGASASGMNPSRAMGHKRIADITRQVRHPIRKETTMAGKVIARAKEGMALGTIGVAYVTLVILGTAILASLYTALALVVIFAEFFGRFARLLGQLSKSNVLPRIGLRIAQS